MTIHSFQFAINPTGVVRENITNILIVIPFVLQLVSTLGLTQLYASTKNYKLITLCL